MNKNQVAGRWDQIKGKIKEKWGELTDDDIAMAEGNRDQFIGKVRAKYGDTEQDIRRQFAEWECDHAGAQRN